MMSFDFSAKHYWGWIHFQGGQLFSKLILSPSEKGSAPKEKNLPRLGGKFHPRYLPVAFAGIYRSGKYSSSGKYWQIPAN